MSNPDLQILTMSNWLKKDLDRRKLIVNHYWFNHFSIVLKVLFLKRSLRLSKTIKAFAEDSYFKIGRKTQIILRTLITKPIYFRESNTDTVYCCWVDCCCIGYWQAQLFGVKNLTIICLPCIRYLKHCVLKWCCKEYVNTNHNAKYDTLKT